MKYPSSKNFILLVVAALVVIGTFLISDYEKGIVLAQQNVADQNAQAAVEASTTMQNSLIAYQGDWQKALSKAFGTSSAWSNGLAGSAGNGSSAANTALTPTQIFSEDLFSKYAEYQQMGADMTDQDTQQQLIGQVMADGTYLPTPKVYDKSNLKLSPDNSLAEVTSYGNAAGNILIKNTTVRAYETDIVQESLAKNDPTVLKELNPIITNYQNMIRELLALKVPSSAADSHVDLVNALNELLFADQGFTKIYTDGVESLNGLTYYKNGIADFNNAMAEMAQYFTAENVNYGPGDGGWIFISRPQVPSQTQSQDPSQSQ